MVGGYRRSGSRNSEVRRNCTRSAQMLTLRLIACCIQTYTDLLIVVAKPARVR